VSELSAATTGPTWRPVPDIAEMLGIVVTKVHQMLRDRTVIAVRRGGVPQIPAEFFDGGEVVRGLPGTITLLTDAGYADDEIVTWLFAADTPAANQAAGLALDPAAGRAANPAADTAMVLLRAGRVKEVHRRAQVAGF